VKLISHRIDFGSDEWRHEPLDYAAGSVREWEWTLLAKRPFRRKRRLVADNE